jgi:L-serine dehydratase
MSTGVFDLLHVCVGPSSSHTSGPMLAASRFAESLRDRRLLAATETVSVELHGSLAATGLGHATDRAVTLGLEGSHPDSITPDHLAARFSEIERSGRLLLAGERPVPFSLQQHVVLHPDTVPLDHPNTVVFKAWAAGDELVDERTYYSVGGGAVREESTSPPAPADASPVPYTFTSMDGLLALCAERRQDIAEIMLRNESALRPGEEVVRGVLDLWAVMQGSVERGLRTDGTLPGGLGVSRRASALRHALATRPEATLRDPLSTLDWVTAYALAVSEENACGGRVVTAPTCGSAGVLPAVLTYCMRFRADATDDDVVTFLLTAAAVGILFRDNASISGADVGCQGEIGVACSMAAAGLAAVLGGTPGQVEEAAEIAMEHNLGLTCDPVAGLVQVPCIERNAMAASKAITAARLALRGDGTHLVSLDAVIDTMLRTGRDMRKEYKETAGGGLATVISPVPVNVIEC